MLVKGATGVISLIHVAFAHILCAKKKKKKNLKYKFCANWKQMQFWQELADQMSIFRGPPFYLWLSEILANERGHYRRRSSDIDRKKTRIRN